MELLTKFSQKHFGTFKFKSEASADGQIATLYHLLPIIMPIAVGENVTHLLSSIVSKLPSILKLFLDCFLVLCIQELLNYLKKSTQGNMFWWCHLYQRYNLKFSFSAVIKFAFFYHFRFILPRMSWMIMLQIRCRLFRIQAVF